MCIPYHDRVRVAHIMPAFERLVVGIDQTPHDRADVECPFATGILLIREQVSQAGEIALLGSRTEIRKVTHIACCRVCCLCSPWESLTCQPISVLVVPLLYATVNPNADG